MNPSSIQVSLFIILCLWSMRNNKNFSTSILNCFVFSTHFTFQWNHKKFTCVLASLPAFQPFSLQPSSLPAFEPSSHPNYQPSSLQDFFKFDILSYSFFVLSTGKFEYYILKLLVLQNAQYTIYLHARARIGE